MGRWFAAVALSILFLFSFGNSRADDIRELRVVVYTQCKSSAAKKADIAQRFERVSRSMQDKAGIRLKIVGWEERCFPIAWTAGIIMAQMKAELGLGDQYDVAVAFTGMTPWGYAANLLSLPSSLGSIDTEYFRFIVIREQWDSVLEHELWHVFLHGHSEGLNAPAAIKFPFGPPLVSNYLSPESLSVIQMNKWRTFNGEIMQEKVTAKVNH
jgi:hypothetical protein